MTEDFSQWRELRRVGRSYLVWDEITREAALFDVDEIDAVSKMIESESIQLRHVFLTHEQSVEALRACFPKFFLHTNAKNALPQHRNRANDFIHLGSLRITNRALIDDKVAYVIGNWPEDAPHVAIVGNVDGVPETIFREKIFSLPKGTLVCSADGKLTILH
jgi:hypothetical protein